MAEDSGAAPLIGSLLKPTSSLPPGPAGLSLFVSKLQMAFNPLEAWARCVQTYGDMVRLNHDTYLVNHPDWIERVLVNADGAFLDTVSRGVEQVVERFWGQGLPVNHSETWRHQRRLIQSAFHHQAIAGYAQVMAGCVARRLETWREGQTLNLRPELMRLSLEMAAKVVLGLDHADTLNDIEAALQTTLHLLDNPAQLDVAIPTRDKKRFQETVKRLDEILYGFIRQRRASGQDQGDVLSKLLAAQDKDGQPLSDQQLRDELVSLLRASHKNTATTLVWTWYLLAQHPQVEAKLLAELDRALGQRQPAWADLASLPYTEMVLKETMRLYPLYPHLVREAVQDTELGGYFIPCKTLVLVSPWLMQRGPRYFDQPERFEPERWAGDLEKRLPNFVYFPFGGGSRLCAVKGYAMLEALLLVAMIAQRFRLRPTSAGKVQPFPFYSGLRPKQDLQFILFGR
jgi:cytochrome P450